jgi:hypothetical protein
MNLSLADLNASLSELAKSLPREAVDQVHRKVAFDVWAGVIKKTPRDEGVAVAGWQASTDREPEFLPNPEPKQPSFDIDVKPFSTTFITNDVPYVLVLEYGGFVPPNPGPSRDPRPDRFGRVLVQGGYSLQAPQGMVDTTIAEIAATL